MSQKKGVQKKDVQKKDVQKKDELLLEIINIFEAHKDELFKIKIKVLVAVKQCQKCPADEKLSRVEQARHWLTNFVSGPLREYRIAYAYHTQEEWEMLKHFDGRQEEEILLDDCLKDVRRCWRKRPSLFKSQNKTPNKKKKKK